MLGSASRTSVETGRLDQTSKPRLPVSALRKNSMICHQTGWSRPMRSISICFSSGVARGPSATLAGSPGTRKTAVYITIITKTRIRRPRPMRLTAYLSIVSRLPSGEIAPDAPRLRSAVHKNSAFSRLEPPAQAEMRFVRAQFGACRDLRVGLAAGDCPTVSVTSLAESGSSGRSSSYRRWTRRP